MIVDDYSRFQDDKVQIFMRHDDRTGVLFPVLEFSSSLGVGHVVFGPVAEWSRPL